MVGKRKIYSLRTFQRALGRMQEVLEGFWAENVDFSFVFNVFGGVSGWARDGVWGWAGAR